MQNENTIKQIEMKPKDTKDTKNGEAFKNGQQTVQFFSFRFKAFKTGNHARPNCSQAKRRNERQPYAAAAALLLGTAATVPERQVAVCCMHFEFSCYFADLLFDLSYVELRGKQIVLTGGATPSRHLALVDPEPPTTICFVSPHNTHACSTNY